MIFSHIKFRGKDVNSGKWVYGSLITSDASEKVAKIVVSDDVDEMYFEEYDVDPDSVGQFTGFCDSNGEKIFEGDELLREDGRWYRVHWDSEIGQWILVSQSGWTMCLFRAVKNYADLVIKKVDKQ